MRNFPTKSGQIAYIMCTKTLMMMIMMRKMMMVMTGEKQYKFEEILPIYKAVNSETDVGTFADFMEAFKTFDREGQGFIAAAELRHVLTSLGNQPAIRLLCV